MNRVMTTAVAFIPFLREGAFDAQSLVTVPGVMLIRRLGVLPVAGMREV